MTIASIHHGYASIDLAQLRERSTHIPIKTPFEHQIEAFAALSQTFDCKRDKPGSGILVLPTGAGKTFTAVRWLIENVIPKNMKILWLAPSFYLLDQAAATVCENAREIPAPRHLLNIRCVSSNPSHSKPGLIQLTDDVVIMTLQTAINNLHTDALDNFGNPRVTPFRQFIDHCRETGLFVVVDEAHHVPAHGCRNLLIGEEDSKLGLRGLVPNLHLLGLTATPTYTDKTRRGWLWKIFTDGIVYEAKKAKLIMQGILARENYIEVPTGKEMEVDDKLYKTLVEQHKDVPEYIINVLATDQPRNNLIVNTYVQNKEKFGKTIIFADRWFQCVYLKQKLIEKGIKADAIYSRIDADPGSAEARNKQTTDDNKRILEQFKTGKDKDGNDSPLDVLINVRMLTEGADVPSVRTVFITRQTTSTILMTQMIGRALRGEKCGGSSEADIVLFFDDWKRLLGWAKLGEGGTQEETIIRKETDPPEYVSIQLIERLSKQINNPNHPVPPFSKTFPVGWYQTEIIYADSEDNYDSMEKYTEFVMVYEHTQAKFKAFIAFLKSSYLLNEWSKEYLDEQWIATEIQPWLNMYFDEANDDIGDRLKSDLVKLVRHIAQTRSIPEYHPFTDRDLYDLDKLAHRWQELPFLALRQHLNQEFGKPGMLWKTFYKSFDRFETATHAAMRKILDEPIYGNTSSEPLPPQSVKLDREELSEEEKEQVKRRDNYTCLACDVKGVTLEIDHIIPRKFGGETSIENSQTLCTLCNGPRGKGINEINFRSNVTQLIRPKLLNLSLPHKQQTVTRVITRIVNFFYHCRAFYGITMHTRSNGRYYSTWKIELYAGNDPAWLLQHKAALLKFIQTELGYDHVQDLEIVTPSREND